MIIQLLHNLENLVKDVKVLFRTSWSMSWISVLNTGAKLYQAGQVGSLASTQGAMLDFQIDQKLRENLRQSEIVETRRMAVKLKGILKMRLITFKLILILP